MTRHRGLTPTRPIPQSGFALLAFVVLVALVGMTWYIGSLAANTQTLKLDRDRVTQTAFAKAKEALISFAAANPDRGALPCPADPANEGVMLTTCPTDALRIGRLPWRTLGIEDLRDGGGESLWYAVSATSSASQSGQRSGRTATASCSPTATDRCFCMRFCTSPATTCRWSS